MWLKCASTRKPDKNRKGKKYKMNVNIITSTMCKIDAGVILSLMQDLGFLKLKLYTGK